MKRSVAETDLVQCVNRNRSSVALQVLHLLKMDCSEAEMVRTVVLLRGRNCSDSSGIPSVNKDLIQYSFCNTLVHCEHSLTAYSPSQRFQGRKNEGEEIKENPFLSGFNGPGPSAAALAIIKHIVLNWEPLRRRVALAFKSKPISS